MKTLMFIFLCVCLSGCVSIKPNYKIQEQTLGRGEVTVPFVHPNLIRDYVVYCSVCDGDCRVETIPREKEEENKPERISDKAAVLNISPIHSEAAIYRMTHYRITCSKCGKVTDFWK